MKFRKKPVVIDAIQFTGNNVREILEFIGNSGTDYPMTNSILINTLEGTMEAKEDDWIIKGVKGEFYPIKADIFQQTYEEVQDAT